MLDGQGHERILEGGCNLTIELNRCKSVRTMYCIVTHCTVLNDDVVG